MDPIEAAIKAIDSRASGASFSYRKIAKQFSISRATLARRHQGLTRSNAGEAQQRQNLSLQQESELVKYIEALTKRGLPPTRVMIQNFASIVAKKKVGRNWVSRFLERNHAHLTSKWTTGIDRVRHKADSKYKYSLYFDLLHQKMLEYEVEPENVYNMDEKGFLIGITGRSKRVFSKALWARKEVTAALQDGSKEWITVLACICADGVALPPALIYEGKTGLQSSWVEDVEVGKHPVFLSNSPTGWTNNNLGLAWLEQVFNRSTRQKARRRWRLLIVDGHGSHVTMDFIKFCDANKILLAIFPPHATHTLQPLDVVLFGPLSASYSKELTTYLHNSQGLLGMRKGDFFTLFWAAWMDSFTESRILKSFEATGISPPNAEAILKRFNNTTSEQDRDPENQEEGDWSSWRQLRRLFDAAVKDTTTVEAQKLSSSLHSMQVQIELLHHENEGLRTALSIKKKHKNKSITIAPKEDEEYYDGFMFWSPRKVRVAEARERGRKQQEEDY
jgi:hypothetical protein